MSHVKEFVVEDAKFKGHENSGTSLELIRTRARIINSSFVSTWSFIGGAIIAINGTIDINQSQFEGNGAEFGGAILAYDSIISISGAVFECHVRRSSEFL